jgi:uncharacterized protein (TIGR03118 family)
MLIFRTGNLLRLTMLVTPLVLPAIVSAGFVQTDLVSDVSGLAAVTDPNLKNPWGLSATPGSPFWVSDQGTGLATLYSGAGVPNALVVTIPGSGTTPPQGPTGQLFNSTASSFQLGTSGKALFIFSTLGGTVDAWNGTFGTSAQVEFTAADHAGYTGLALGSVAANDFLYAADFANAKIDVLDSTFGKVTPAGTFVDPTLPAGYSPYNIQNINGQLYVEYALVDPVTHRASTNANTGVVSVFDTSGNFVKRLVTNTNLDSPWGIALAPAGFGNFGGDLLVGNFGNGVIDAFDLSGGFMGVVTDLSGAPIVNSGLWGLSFHAAATGFDPNTLYFNAGINGEADGLFGAIQFTPEPSTFVLMTLVMGCGLVFRRRFLSR